MIDKKRLRYRNQFILAPYYIESLTAWKRIEIKSDLKLTVHPDLEVTQYGDLNNAITLLGYVLDPNNPQKTNFEIIADMHALIFKDKCTYFEPTFDFGGRWILIIEDIEEIILFNDPAGLRQVVYSSCKHAKNFWCASQPGLIAKELNLNIDSDAANFLKFFKEKNDEYFMPGDSTPYCEIAHLLPNHYLILNKKICKRFWPQNKFKLTNLKEATDKCSNILEGLLIAASYRFDLCLSLSSGLDSRLLLAASRKITKKINFLSEIKEGTDKNHPDVIIPSKILKKFKLKHHIISIESITPIEEWYSEIFKYNVLFFHEKWIPKAATYFKLYDLNKLDVVGTVSAIAKLYYHKIAESKGYQFKDAAAFELAGLLNIEASKFAIDKINHWLNSIETIYNFNLLDIFYWELNAGRWVASNNLEFDIGWQDILVPYNCRTLLVVMLSTDKIYRNSPKYILYEKIIRFLWPEILSKPINPHKQIKIITKIKKRIEKLLRIY